MAAAFAALWAVCNQMLAVSMLRSVCPDAGMVRTQQLGQKQGEIQGVVSGLAPSAAAARATSSSLTPVKSHSTTQNGHLRLHLAVVSMNRGSGYARGASAFQRPENALKRAEELQKVGQKTAAVLALHDVLTSRRHRAWNKGLEEIVFRFIDLCVEERMGRYAKEALMQYRNTCQNVNINSLEEVIKYLLKRATEKAEEAQAQADVCSSSASNLGRSPLLISLLYTCAFTFGVAGSRVLLSQASQVPSRVAARKVGLGQLATGSFCVALGTSSSTNGSCSPSTAVLTLYIAASCTFAAKRRSCVQCAALQTERRLASCRLTQSLHTATASFKRGACSTVWLSRALARMKAC